MTQEERKLLSFRAYSWWSLLVTFHLFSSVVRKVFASSLMRLIEIVLVLHLMKGLRSWLQKNKIKWKKRTIKSSS